MTLKYFDWGEFDSPDLVGSGSNMAPAFLYRLDYAREIAGIPFHINSGFRTPEHNKKVGGDPFSRHLKGMAVDIRARTARERALVIKGLVLAGLLNLRIYPTHIHVNYLSHSLVTLSDELQ